MESEGTMGRHNELTKSLSAAAPAINDSKTSAPAPATALGKSTSCTLTSAIGRSTALRL